jgi:hypothetical protein
MPSDRKLPPLDTDADRIVWLAGLARRRIDTSLQELFVWVDTLPHSEEKRRATSLLHDVLNGLVCVSNEGERIERLRKKTNNKEDT